jgi:hypothetical protein
MITPIMRLDGGLTSATGTLEADTIQQANVDLNDIIEAAISGGAGRTGSPG